MYISSYSTYVQAHTSNKHSQSKMSYSYDDSFKNKLKRDPNTEITPNKSLPIDYTKKSSHFHTKLQDQERTLQESTNREKYIKFKILNNAKIAYQDNATFPLLFQQTDSMPTQKLQENLEPKEKAMYKKMINTYLQNDKYYKITA